MVGLVLFIMYSTANSRGGIEAILFFWGWAVLGSFLVGGGVIYMVLTVRSACFWSIYNFTFTPNEVYLLCCLFFAGFGVKLSVWPFWYWLPRAHVEVSTGMSIFLSCILIKVCFYGLMRTYYLIGGEVIIMPLLCCCGWGVLDVTIRLIVQTDLKAITAYGSVLHINLLVLLFLCDTTYMGGGLLFYIWGHSYATAGLFYAIHLVERCTGSRITNELGGVYNASPQVGIVVIFALIAFLGFPLSFFFWGEVWL